MSDPAWVVGAVQQFENGWFICREITRRGKAHKQWFRLTNPELIAAAQEAERQATATTALRRELRGPERTALISKVIEEVAGVYCRRVWWADKLELMQEAWAEVLAALDRKPCPEDLQGPYDVWLRGTVSRIASRRMMHFLWSCSAPVTGARGSRKWAEGLKRLPLASGGERDDGPQGVELIDPSASPELGLAQREAAQGIARAREVLYWQVLELYAGTVKREGERARGLLLDAVLRVLCDNIPSGQAAADHGLDVRDVYTETTRIKRLLIEDRQARAALAEIREWRQDLQ